MKRKFGHFPIWQPDFSPPIAPQHAPHCLANLCSSPLAVKFKRRQKSISHVLVVGLSSPSLTCEPPISFQLTLLSVRGLQGKKGLHIIIALMIFAHLRVFFKLETQKQNDLLHTNLRKKGGKVLPSITLRQTAIISPN